MKRDQSGFTLLELAIVLTVIGLLLSGVLKGQELIGSASVKSLAEDFKHTQMFLHAYQGSYRALPGDDIQAASHVGAAVSGDGNGLIEGDWNAASGESFTFWQHIRLAGLAPGASDADTSGYVPLNSAGGRLGVSSIRPIQQLAGSYFTCSDRIPGKLARQLDGMMDDGDTAKGFMQTTAAGTGHDGPAENDLTDGTPYLVCMGF